MNNIGIYSLQSIFDDRVYIGSTIHLDKRKKQHFVELRKQNHRNRYLQNFYNKYGEDSLRFEILERCDADELYVREQEHLDSVSKKNRFNIVEDVTMPPSTKGMIYSQEWRDNISKSLIGYKHNAQHRQKRREYMLSDKNPMNNPESRKKISDSQRSTTDEECKRIWELNQSRKYTPKELSEIVGFTGSELMTSLRYAQKYFYPEEEIYRVGKYWKRTFSDEECIKLLIEHNSTPINVRELVEKYGSCDAVIDRALRRARKLKLDLKMNPDMVLKKYRNRYDINGTRITMKT